MKKKILALTLSAITITSIASFAATQTPIAKPAAQQTATKVTYTKATDAQSKLIVEGFKKAGADVSGVVFQKPSNANEIIPKKLEALYTARSKAAKLTGEITSEIFVGTKTLKTTTTKKDYTIYYVATLNKEKTKLVGAFLDIAAGKAQQKVSTTRMYPVNLKKEVLDRLATGIVKAAANKPATTQDQSVKPTEKPEVAPNEQTFDIKGSVSSIQSKDGVAKILVEKGRDFASTYDSVNVTINENTAITIKGSLTRELKTIEDIKVGEIVEVKFVGPVSRSIPAQATAASIAIVPTSTTVRGTIDSNDKANKRIHVKNTLKEVSIVDDIIVNIADNTVIVKQGDKTNKRLAQSDLKIGDRLEIEVSQAMTMSLPPQTTAIKIVIVEK